MTANPPNIQSARIILPDIHATIREARTRAGLSQRQLGEALGYDGSYAEVSVRRWELGSRPVPIDKVRQLAAVLGLTLDDLIP